MEPINAPKLEFHGVTLMAVISVVALIIAVTASVTLGLVPYVDVLLANHYALCGNPENFNFVISLDALGIPWATTTPMCSDTRQSYGEWAVQQFKEQGWAIEQIQLNTPGISTTS